MPFTRCLCLLAVLMAVSGCRAAQLQNDQDAFRARLQQMHTDQIMDNLIQGSQGLPFVQLDYTKITGTVTQGADGSFNESQTVGRTLGAATRTLSTMYGFTARGTQQNQLTVTADPIVNQPSVYKAYLEFLKKPERLVTSDEKPPEGASLVCRQKCGRWYWVPVEYRDDFRELSFKVVSMRGDAAEAPTTFDVKIEGVVDQEFKNDVKDENDKVVAQQWELTIKVNRQLPTDDGQTQFVLNGYVYPLPFFGIDEGGEVGKRMDRIRVIYLYDLRRPEQVTAKERKNQRIPVSPDEFAKQIVGTDAKLTLNDHRPSVTTSKDLLRSIDHELQLQRMDRLRPIGSQ